MYATLHEINTIEKNIWWGDGFRVDAGNTPRNNLNINPLLVNPDTFDFRLQGTSPAIDTGLNIDTARTTDFDDLPRPPTARDIGAHEFQTTTNRPPPEGKNRGQD